MKKLLVVLSISFFGISVAMEDKDALGRTALHRAVDQGDTKKADQLLNDGADICALEQNNCTPLHLAAQSGDVDMAALLLLHGARQRKQTEMIENKRNLVGMKPVDLANLVGAEEVVQVLSDPQKKDEAILNYQRKLYKEWVDSDPRPVLERLRHREIHGKF